MPWSVSHVYAQATSRLRASLIADPYLGPFVHHIRSLGGFPWPQRKARHGLPTGGLLAIPYLGPPGHHRDTILPWDGLRPATATPHQYPTRDTLAQHGLARLRGIWPPASVLGNLKRVAIEGGGPVSLLRAATDGGSLDYEVAWIHGWRRGELDRLLFQAPDLPPRAWTTLGLRECGDVLSEMLEYHRLPGISYFAPHTGRFEWARARVVCDREREAAAYGLSLDACVARGDLDGIAALADDGVEAADYTEGDTPLSRAAASSTPAILERVLAADAWSPEQRLHALHQASARALALPLLTSLTPLAPEDRTALLATHALHGRTAILDRLCDEDALVQLQPEQLDRLWSPACRGGARSLVRALIERGVSPTRRAHTIAGQTGLDEAALGGHEALALELLDLGVPTSPETFYCACVGGCLELVRILAARDVDARIDRRTFADAIGSARSEAAALALLDLALALEHDPLVGSTGAPLQRAADRGMTAIIERLSDLGVALEGPDPLGRTALHRAVISGQSAAISTLLRLGADPQACDQFGVSVRAEAAHRGISFP